ncbi:MAG: hypothetical protein V1703_01125 [Candidatus Altiarchaeota archaeon]
MRSNRLIVVRRKKPVKVVDGSDFARVFLRYGLERLVKEGHYSIDELSNLDNNGVYTRHLLADKSFRKRLENIQDR